MPSPPAANSAPIATGLQPPKKDKTPRNSAGGRTPRPNPNVPLPGNVPPPDPRALTKKARKAVNVKGNRGKGQSKSGGGGVAVDEDGNDPLAIQVDEDVDSGSSEEYDDGTGSAPRAELPMRELIKAAEEKAAKEPVKLSSGYEIITNPASKPMLFDARNPASMRGYVARRKDSLASSSGFTDESDWSELNDLDMDGVVLPAKKANYADVLKRATSSPKGTIRG